MNNISSIEKLEKELSIEKAAHRQATMALALRSGMPIDNETLDILMEDRRECVAEEI